MLMRGMALSDDLRGRCQLLLQLYDNNGGEWQLGKTKVSFKMILSAFKNSLNGFESIRRMLYNIFIKSSFI